MLEDSLKTHSTSSVIELTDVQFQWENSKQPILTIPQLTINKGEHLFIKGPSGCGKSTLLSLLTGINAPTKGNITILGTTLSSLSSRQRDRFRADYIGYIFQQFNLLPYLSIIDNVLLPCQFSKLRRKQTHHRAIEEAKRLLTQLRLDESLFSRSVTELSIGQQQRVAAARALIGEPKVIIADEPTSALDHDNRLFFIELLLAEANRVGSTLIFVSHDPTLETLFEQSLYLPQFSSTTTN